jgi:hypothetical protein
MAGASALWKLADEPVGREPGTLDVEPMLGGTPVDENGRLFDPRDTDWATGVVVMLFGRKKSSP